MFWMGVSRSFRLIVLGDLNGWIGDQKRDGVTDENGRKVIDFCEERGMCVSSTFFKHKSIHKYTRVGVGRDLSLIHISEPTRLLSISYAVFCLKKKKTGNLTTPTPCRLKL